ncbi:HAD family hydrolase [bacterium]|nr:HAD family hydrolase [candidate division CSSED10-310 bacterium]
MMKGVESVIFDMDGTLFDSPLDFNAIRKHFAIPLNQGVLESISHMQTLQRQKAEKDLLMFEMRAAEKTILKPGVQSMLAELKAKQLSIGLLTRNARNVVRYVLKKHPQIQFDAVVTRDDGPVKPDPESILSICRKFHADPAKTLCIGDYLYDIIAANEAGSISVFFSDRFGQFPILEPRLHDIPAQIPPYAKNACFIISDISQVLNLIKMFEAEI